MNAYLTNTLAKAQGGRVFATFSEAGRLQMVCLGEHEDVRHRYNQMACLIAATAMQTLLATRGVTHSTAAPAGSWFDHLDGNRPVGTPTELFELASQGPSARADAVGYLASRSDWPQAMMTLSGVKNMCKSMVEVGTVLYYFEAKPSAQVGQSHDVSAIARAKEGIKAAKRAGYTPYNEEVLMQFLQTLDRAKALHFLHEVIAA